MRSDDVERVRKGRKKTLDGAREARAHKRRLELLPAGIAVIVGVVFLLPVCLIPHAVFFTLIVGLGLSIFGFVKGCFLAMKEGNYIAFDYLESLGPLRWLLAVGFFGLYISGYLTLWMVTQIGCAVSKPKVFLPWFGIQAYGIVVIVMGFVFAGISSSLWHLVLGDHRPVEHRVNADAFRKEPEPRKEQKPVVEPPKPPPIVTGEPEIDRKLADLTSKKLDSVKAAADSFAEMEPNAHRPPVAKTIGDALQMAPVAHRPPLIRALAVWTTANEIPVFVQLLSDPDIGTRHEVLRIVGKFHDERTVAPVIACFVEFSTTYWGERALVDLGPVAEKQVLALLGHKSLGIRQSTCRVLRSIGTPMSIPALQKAASEFEVRGIAESAITAIQARYKK